MVQVEFERKEENKTRRMVVWVDAGYNLRKGSVVSFIDVDNPPKWKVVKVYKTRLEFADIDKKWGLALPKSQRTER